MRERDGQEKKYIAINPKENNASGMGADLYKMKIAFITDQPFGSPLKIGDNLQSLPVPLVGGKVLPTSQSALSQPVTNNNYSGQYSHFRMVQDKLVSAKSNKSPKYPGMNKII